MAEESQRRSVVQLVGAVFVTPPRIGLTLLLGAGVMAVRLVNQAVEEGEPVLARAGSALREQPRRTPPSDEPAIEIQQPNDTPMN